MEDVLPSGEMLPKLSSSLIENSMIQIQHWWEWRYLSHELFFSPDCLTAIGFSFDSVPATSDSSPATACTKLCDIITELLKSPELVKLSDDALLHTKEENEISAIYLMLPYTLLYGPDIQWFWFGFTLSMFVLNSLAVPVAHSSNHCKK